MRRSTPPSHQSCNKKACLPKQRFVFLPFGMIFFSKVVSASALYGYVQNPGSMEDMLVELNQLAREASERHHAAEQMVRPSRPASCSPAPYLQRRVGGRARSARRELLWRAAERHGSRSLQQRRRSRSGSSERRRRRSRRGCASRRRAR